MSGPFVLLSGNIFRKELKTSKTGTAYMCATVPAQRSRDTVADQRPFDDPIDF